MVKMMRKIALVAFFLFTLSIPSAIALAADGVIEVKSEHSAKDTADRLERILAQKGMTIFDRIPHSKSAANVGVELRYTELIIFGNPKVGSPLMKCEQSVAIDLPQKALVWEDSGGQVFISYNDPRYLQKRHAISGCEEVLAKIEKALAGITHAAAMK